MSLIFNIIHAGLCNRRRFGRYSLLLREKDVVGGDKQNGLWKKEENGNQSVWFGVSCLFEVFNISTFEEKGQIPWGVFYSSEPVGIFRDYCQRGSLENWK